MITVVGDVKPDEIKRTIEQALAGWKAGGSMPSFDYPPPPAPKSTTIYLVDKPGAAQSTFAIGSVGPPRSTPDYYALRVMNEMLGALFQSRLNHNIREVKGYSYGVGLEFRVRKRTGSVPRRRRHRHGEERQRADRVHEGAARHPRPAPADVMMRWRRRRRASCRACRQAFESVNGVNGSIASIYTQGLPEDYYQQFARAVNAVTKEDVVRVAQKYIDPDHLPIVIVGDRDEDRGAARPPRRSRRSCGSTSTAIRSPTEVTTVELRDSVKTFLSTVRWFDTSIREVRAREDHSLPRARRSVVVAGARIGRARCAASSSPPSSSTDRAFKARVVHEGGAAIGAALSISSFRRPPPRHRSSTHEVSREYIDV